MSKYGHSMLNIHRIQCISCDTRYFVCCGEKRLRFAFNVLNTKTIILLNLAEYRLIIAHSTYGLVG